MCHGSTSLGQDFWVKFPLNRLLLGRMVSRTFVVINCTLYHITIMTKCDQDMHTTAAH